MTRDDFQRYLDAFNNDDFDGFSSFYADDVDFNLGDRKRIVGKQGIVDFYRPVKEHIREDLRIIDIAVAPDGDRPARLHQVHHLQGLAGLRTLGRPWPASARSRAWCPTNTMPTTSSPTSSRRASGHIERRGSSLQLESAPAKAGAQVAMNCPCALARKRRVTLPSLLRGNTLFVD